MKERYLIVAGRIRQELDDVERVLRRAQRAMAAAKGRSDEQSLLIDAAALNLHDFYTGLERIFQHISASVDDSMPSGGDWHRDLLNQMSLGLPRVRPEVLSPRATAALREYLGFRHVVRNVYAFELDQERVEHLVDRAGDVFSQIRGELEDFAVFLEQVETDDSGVE